MICINDLVQPYERYNIHPGQKEAVGRRLCDLALNKTYGKKQFPVGRPMKWNCQAPKTCSLYHSDGLKEQVFDVIRHFDDNYQSI